MKRVFFTSIAFGLATVGVATVALAAPRNASSKIRGDYSFDSGSARASTMYRAPAPMVAQPRRVAPVPAPQVARTETNRRYSYAPPSRAEGSSACTAETAAVAPSQRRYSYEPGVATERVGRRYTAPSRSKAFSTDRDAGFKIRGDF